MKIIKADLITLGEYNRAIRKYSENWVFYCDRYVMYGLDKDDCNKLSLYKYFISFVDLDSIKLLQEDIFKDTKIYGKSLSDAIRDRCEEMILSNDEIIMYKGKSDTKFTVGIKLNDKYLKNIYHLSDRYFNMEKSFGLSKDNSMSRILEENEVDAIKKYAHMKIKLGEYNDIPVNMYITIKLIPACGIFGNINILTSYLEDDKYNVLIHSTPSIKRLGNTSITTLHRIINI